MQTLTVKSAYQMTEIIINFRREQWPLFSSYACWQQLVTQTRNLSRDHVALSEVYSTHLVSRLAQVMEDVQRIYKRVSIILMAYLRIILNETAERLRYFKNS